MVRYSSTYNTCDSAAFYVDSVANKTHPRNYLSIKYHKFSFLPVLTNSDFNYKIHHNNKQMFRFHNFFKTLYSAITTC